MTHSLVSTRHATVDSFAELAGRPLTNGINALCWPRTLAGDFGEVARLLAPGVDVVTVDADMLQALSLSPAGRIAAPRRCVRRRRRLRR